MNKLRGPFLALFWARYYNLSHISRALSLRDNYQDNYETSTDTRDNYRKNLEARSGAGGAGARRR
jgi:hypothetical protein